MTRATDIAIIGGTQPLIILATQIVLIVLMNSLDPSNFRVYAVCKVVISLALVISNFELEVRQSPVQ